MTVETVTAETVTQFPSSKTGTMQEIVILESVLVDRFGTSGGYESPYIPQAV